MHICYVGIDIAKHVFQVHAADRRGAPVWRTKLKRSNWLDAVCDRVPTSAVIAMEACGSANHWARLLQARGYTVKLIAPQFVKPYVKSNKNDRVDAEAICEALSRPGMRFVTPKTIQQQDTQAMHRIRSELIEHRTAKVNQIRGLAAEYGIVAPQGVIQLRRAVPDWLEDAQNGLTFEFRSLLQGLYEDLQRADDRIAELNRTLEQQVASDPVATRLMTLRGVGPLIASALSVALGDAKAFSRGRDFAVSTGLTPRQNSSGGKERLLGISKRGHPYLRTLLIHGARSVIRHAKNRNDPLSQWIQRLGERKHFNVVTVALANKTARMAWAVVHGETEYNPALSAAA